MKASIIIPAYNSEEFISETLDSAVAQTIDDFEIICINDGSKDSTIDILREYEQENDNVIVIDKENEGVAAARNDGIKIAKGEFLYFLDADDLLESTALEHMYEKAKKYKADLVIAQYDIFDESRTYMIKDLEDTVLKPTIDKYDLDIINTFSLCNKFFKKEIIDKNDMKIP
ncbi:MAG: glycosyltransferase family 2 protein, partial [Eubacterium sp.]|nr:glycosyltransferase family 2 protein [Eubacterium sp.]